VQRTWIYVAIASAVTLGSTVAIASKNTSTGEVTKPKKTCPYLICPKEKQGGGEPAVRTDTEKKTLSKARRFRIDYSKRSAEECLAMNIVGEAAGEREKGRVAVAYVTVMEARDQGIKVCAEVFGGRYDWTDYSSHHARVERNRLKNTKTWQQAKQIAGKMIKHPVPPEPEIKFARNFFRPEHSSPGGRAWFKKNTISLKKIGNHVFCAPLRYSAAVAKQQAELLLAKLPHPRPNPKRYVEVAALPEVTVVPMPRPNPKRIGQVALN
jgi:spore germination cell wall hydrolase CwlJ-like protein